MYRKYIELQSSDFLEVIQIWQRNDKHNIFQIQMKNLHAQFTQQNRWDSAKKM